MSGTRGAAGPNSNAAAQAEAARRAAERRRQEAERANKAARAQREQANRAQQRAKAASGPQQQKLQRAATREDRQADRSERTAQNKANDALASERAANEAARKAGTPAVPFAAADKVDNAVDAASLSQRDQQKLFGAPVAGVSQQQAREYDQRAVTDALNKPNDPNAARNAARELRDRLQGIDPSQRAQFLQQNAATVNQLVDRSDQGKNDTRGTFAALAQASELSGPEGRALIASSLQSKIGDDGFRSDGNLAKGVNELGATPEGARLLAVTRDGFSQDGADDSVNAIETTAPGLDNRARQGATPADLLQLDQLPPLSSQPPGSRKIGPDDLPPSQREKVDKLIADGDQKGATQWLQQNRDPRLQAAFMARVFQDPEKARTLFGATPDDGPTNDSRYQRAFGKALDYAQQYGAVDAGDMRNLATYKLADSNTAASVVRDSGNPELIRAYADQELKNAKSLEDDSTFSGREPSASAANALSGLPPDQLNAWIKDNPEQAKFMRETIDNDLPDEFTDNGNKVPERNKEAFARFLDTAGQARPPNRETINFFLDSANTFKGNDAVQNAKARFLGDNFDAIVNQLSAGNPQGKIENGPDGKNLDRLTAVFQETLLGDGYAGQQRLRDQIGQSLRGLAQGANDALQRSQRPGDAANAEAARRANLLGSITGAYDNAIDAQIKATDDRNAVLDRNSSFLTSLVSDFVPLPPGGSALIEQERQRVVDDLREKPAEQNRYLLRDIVEANLNPSISGEFDGARTTAEHDA